MSKVLKRSLSGVAPTFPLTSIPSSDVRFFLGWVRCCIGGAIGLHGRLCVPEFLTWASDIPGRLRVDPPVVSKELCGVWREGWGSGECATIFPVGCWAGNLESEEQIINNYQQLKEEKDAQSYEHMLGMSEEDYYVYHTREDFKRQNLAKTGDLTGSLITRLHVRCTM